VKAEAALVRELHGLSRPQEIGGNALLQESVRRVHMEVDEAGEDERPTRDGGIFFDRNDEAAFDRQPAGPGAVDGIDEKSL
jgi:hypothetical protein